MSKIAKFLDPITGDKICEMEFANESNFYDLRIHIMMGLDMNPNDPKCKNFITSNYPELEQWCFALQKINDPKDSPNEINYYLEDYITEFNIVGFYSDQRYKVIEIQSSSLSDPSSLLLDDTGSTGGVSSSVTGLGSL